MCADSRVLTAIRTVTASQPTCSHTECILPVGVADVTWEAQAGVGTSSLLHLTNIPDMFRTFQSNHLEVHRHNNVRQSQYLRNFYYVIEGQCGYAVSKMLHKLYNS